MRPGEGDQARLWDMLTYAREAVSICGSSTFLEFEEDNVRRLAVERCIEIIGEAARNVSRPFQRAHPGHPLAKDRSPAARSRS